MKKNEIPTKKQWYCDMQREILEGLKKLNYSENVDKETVQNWINKDLKMEYYSDLSVKDIVLYVTCS